MTPDAQYLLSLCVALAILLPVLLYALCLEVVFLIEVLRVIRALLKHPNG